MKKMFLLLLIVVISALSAAPVAAAAVPVPDELHVSLWPEYNDNQVLFLEGIRYPENTPLPIEVKMAVPKGMTIIWVGELTGGEAAQDIVAAHQVNPKEDYDEVVFTLTKSRVGQLEAAWPGLKVNGKERTLGLDWIQRYESKLFTLDFRAPTQASDIKMSPPASAPGGSAKGQEFISVAPMNLSVGQKQSFTITYQRSTDVPSVSDQQGQQAQGTPGGGASPMSSTAMIVVVIAVITVGMFTVYKMQQARQGEAYSDSEPDVQEIPVDKKTAHEPVRDSGKKHPDSGEKHQNNPAPDDDEQNFFFD